MLESLNDPVSLVLFPQEVLRNSCKPLPVPTPELTILLANMHLLMNERHGVGLAAPQVGLAFRLFIMQADPTEPLRAFINPRLLAVSKEQELGEEGCLSLPNVYAPVLRACEIELEYLTLQGGKKRENFSGFQARIIQHEVDHLDGILFVDHLKPSLKRRLLKKYLSSLRKGKRVD